MNTQLTLTNPADRQQLIAMASSNPEQAIALFATSCSALEAPQQAAMLELMLERAVDAEGASDTRVSAQLAETLSVSQLAQIVAARGDLPGMAVQLADLDTIFEALFGDILEGDDLKEAEALFTLMAWAPNLAMREDWEHLLSMEYGKYTIEQWLVVAVVNSRSDADREISADEWETLGLDSNDATEILASLREKGNLPKITDGRRVEAFQRRAERRRAFEQAREQLSVAKAAEGLDF